MGEGEDLDPEEEADDGAEVGKRHHEPVGQLELAPDAHEAHGLDHVVQGHPELAIARGVCVRAAVGDDVELSYGGAPGVESRFSENETMAVVVDVGEANTIVPVAKDAQEALARRLQHVREEEVIAGAVDLVRCDGHSHEIVAARLPHGDLPEGLGLGILLEVAALGDGGHLRLGETIHVRTVEPGETQRPAGKDRGEGEEGRDGGTRTKDLVEGEEE